MSVIGKNPNLSVRGIRPARTLLPKYKQVIGDCSHLFNVTLPFSKLTFARATEEYLLYNGVLTKQATANEPATRVIGGRVFMQSEPAVTQQTVQTLAYSTWTSARIASITANQSGAPDGSSTAVSVIPNTISGIHALYRTDFAITSGNYYVVSIIATDYGYDWVRLTSAGARFGAGFSAYYNVASGAVGTVSGCTAGIIPAGNGYYQCLLYTPIATGTGNETIEMDICNADGGLSFSGDGSSGLQLWHFSCTAGVFPPSVIAAAGSPTVKPKTNPYYAEADVPAWMRNRFYFELITNHYTSAMLAADGGEKHLWSFDPTAGGIAVRCYIDGADNKMKVDLEGTGNIITSAALTPTLDGLIRCWFTFDNGANSVLRIIGAGVDAEYTGVQLAAADGKVCWVQREDETLQPSLLISQPEMW